MGVQQGQARPGRVPDFPQDRSGCPNAPGSLPPPGLGSPATPVPTPPLRPAGKGKDKANDLPGGFAALLHGDLVRLPLVLRHWGQQRPALRRRPDRAAPLPPPGPAANLRSIFFATSV